MPLCVITEVIALNTTFYAEFASISDETTFTYEWILNQVRELHQHCNVPDPVFVGTDCEVDLITVIE